MSYANFVATSGGEAAEISWGHFSAVFFTIVLLLGITWVKQPQLFNLQKNQNREILNANVPRYYAYVETSALEPLVAGASTIDGPSIINEDGTVSPVDMGEVLGASTKDVKLSLEDVEVNAVGDSDEAIKNYLASYQKIKNNAIDNSSFETALSSNNQTLINEQANKIKVQRDALQKLAVPLGLVKLAKLTIIQYSAAIGVLENFTQADNNPQLVGQFLQEFLKSQEDMDAEISLVAKNYNLDPIMLGAVSLLPAN